MKIFEIPGIKVVMLLALSASVALGGPVKPTLRKLGGPHSGVFNGTVEVKQGGVVVQRFVLENEQGTVTIPGLQKKRAKISFDDPTLGKLNFDARLDAVTLSRNCRVARAKSIEGNVSVPGVGKFPVTLVRPKVKRKGRTNTVAKAKIRANADLGGGVVIGVNATVRGVGKF